MLHSIGSSFPVCQRLSSRSSDLEHLDLKAQVGLPRDLEAWVARRAVCVFPRDVDRRPLAELHGADAVVPCAPLAVSEMAEAAEEQCGEETHSP